MVGIALGRRRAAAGIVGLTIGYLAVAGSSVVLLAAGPRILGSDRFSALALVWTLSTVFGLGFALPTEQVITRRISARESDALRPFRWLLLWAGSSALVVPSLSASLPAAQTSGAFVTATLLAVLGWVAACRVRGPLAGSGHLTRYSAVLVAEAAVRMVLVVLAILFPRWADALLAAAVGGPLVLSAVVGLLLRQPLRRPLVAPSGDHSGEYLFFGVVSVAYQICLNGPALALDWHAGAVHPALVGVFVAVSAVLRAPALLVGGLSTQALVTLSADWARGDRGGYADGTRVLFRRWSRLVPPVTGLIVVLSPWLLPLYYGSAVDLPVAVVIALAVSTVFATAAAVGAGPLFAAGRGRTAAAAWAVGAVVTMTIVAASAGATPWLVAGLMAGPALAALMVIRGLLATLRVAPTAGSNAPARAD